MLSGKSNQKVSIASGELNTIIGANSVVEGKLQIQNSVRVNGKVIGELKTTGVLTIGNQGYIEGGIKASSVIIGGKVKGSIVANGKVTMESSSVFIGDLITPSLSIAEGAIFDGNCIMNGDDKKVEPPKKEPETKESDKEENGDKEKEEESEEK